MPCAIHLRPQVSRLAAVERMERVFNAQKGFLPRNKKKIPTHTLIQGNNTWRVKNSCGYSDPNLHAYATCKSMSQQQPCLLLMFCFVYGVPSPFYETNEQLVVSREKTTHDDSASAPAKCSQDSWWRVILGVHENNNIHGIPYATPNSPYGLASG